MNGRFLCAFYGVTFSLMSSVLPSAGTPSDTFDRHLDSLFEQAPVPMLILDRDRVVRGINRSAEQLGGTSIGRAIGQPSGLALRCVHHLAGDAGCGFSSDCGSCSLRNAILETFRSGRPRYRVEAFLEREPGQPELSFLVSVVPFGPPQDGLVLVTLEDVTERKRAERALKSSRANFHNTVECMDIGIIVADTDGITRYVNPATEALMNRPYLELVGTRLDFPLVDGAATEVELLDGPRHHRFVDVRTVNSRWEGKPAFLISLWDNTDRRLAEQAVAEHRERLALVIEGSNDGIWDWNILTGEVYFSNRWKSMLGYGDREIENHIDSWKRLLHPEDRERALATIQDYFEGRTATYELEHRLLHKDGGYRWILARGSTLRDPGGRPTRMVGTHVDLTDRRRAEENLRAMYRRLEESHEKLKQAQLTLIQAAKLESVGTLAAGVAHEVKNPLQILLMGLRYLSRHLPPDRPELQRTVDDMRSATRRADAIVRGLLEFSASHQLALRDESIAAVVESSLQLVQYELIKHRVRLEMDVPANPAPLPMDRIKIEQVLVNLFLNAIDAMSGGGTLSIRIFSHDRDAAGQTPESATAQPTTVIEVADTGPGIPPDRIARIFDPFFTTKSVGKGTGLGLTVAKNIIELHGGTIGAQNRAGGGLLVTIAFRNRKRTDRDALEEGVMI